MIPSSDYIVTFSTDQDRAACSNLLATACETIYLPFEQASETAFYAAGKHIVQYSDVMLAVWNGRPAKGLGGTGDVVNYALAQHKKIIHINPILREIVML